MRTGDKIKIFDKSQAIYFKKLARSLGYRSVYLDGYVLILDPILKPQKKDISGKIKRVRERRNLDQKEFADSIGVVKTTVANWESGKNFPDKYNRKMLKRKYGIII